MVTLTPSPWVSDAANMVPCVHQFFPIPLSPVHSPAQNTVSKDPYTEEAHMAISFINE